MSSNKTNDTKKKELGPSVNEHGTGMFKGMNSNVDSKSAKIVSISQASEKRKIELINQIIKTTPSF